MTCASVRLSVALASAEVFDDGDWVETKDQDPDGDVRLIQLADVGDGVYVDKSFRFMTSAKARTLRCTFLEVGDVLVARMPDPLGRACIFPGDSKPAVTVVDVCIVRPDLGQQDPRWLMHCLNGPACRNQIADLASGTTRSRISRTNLGRIEIPVVPLVKQRRIAEVLDRAEALRAKRRVGLMQLDTLRQAIFFSLFGARTRNSGRWPRAQLVALCSSANDIKCGPFGTQLAKAEFRTEGVPLWGIKNVNALFELPPHEFLEPGTAKKLIQYSIQPGDIAMTRKGTVGNCAVYPDDFPGGIMHSDLLRLRVARESCEPVFLAHQLHHSPDVERQLALISGGAVMPGINVTKLKTLEVFVPPLTLQQDFVRRVAGVEKLKAAHRASLTEMDALFASLQHWAFRGEL